ncbi:MarR family transcriptional regulator [Ancylobacter sp. 6x-1]|uniref:MarR family transcriptional regulator n=1 Tax=Ancylobacter crimeensis TaxID=2579147 RepID=A0ABT0DFM0_9HYPH|nr:MarR family transcriptional regulator [Ancylobacter crimeensis]MCK0198742.1 MarR family transcriptional regulator [Ancylobacter crimeensis]
MDSQPSPRLRFGITFSLLARRWRRTLEAHLSAAGLSGATWVPLVHLRETGGGISQKELAALVGVDGSSLVRVLDILAREGLIERRKDERDGRTNLIHLTTPGKERVGEIRRTLGAAEEAMLADLADCDLAAMLGHFEAIGRRMAQIEASAAQEARS